MVKSYNKSAKASGIQTQAVRKSGLLKSYNQNKKYEQPTVRNDIKRVIGFG